MTGGTKDKQLWQIFLSALFESFRRRRDHVRSHDQVMFTHQIEPNNSQGYKEAQRAVHGARPSFCPQPPPHPPTHLFTFKSSLYSMAPSKSSCLFYLVGFEWDLTCGLFCVILEPASTAGKAPASTAGTASKAPAKTVDKAAKKATKKTAVPVEGEKKKTRKKTRKETYSSYIYKGSWSFSYRDTCRILMGHL